MTKNDLRAAFRCDACGHGHGPQVACDYCSVGMPCVLRSRHQWADDLDAALTWHYEWARAA